MGRGGIAAVMAATGMSSATVHKGLSELEAVQSGGAVLPPERIRRPGGGRQRATDKQPGLARALQRLVKPTARGDPEFPLRWPRKSTRKLADELSKQGFKVGSRTVAKELEAQQLSLQANRKTREGTSHADRDAQFARINEQVLRFQRRRLAGAGTGPLGLWRLLGLDPLLSQLMPSGREEVPLQRKYSNKVL